MNEPNPEIIVRLHQLNQHKHHRHCDYGQVADQLDMLFKDIDAGLFGEQAKTGLFYNHIKNIKDRHPKIDSAERERIQSELNELFARE